MDLTQNVKVVISGDAAPLEKVTKQAEQAMIKSQRNVQSAAGKGGKDAGEAFGRDFARAQEKWLKVAEDAFRKYGGKWGGYVADALSQFDKITKAREATAKLGAGGMGAGSAGAIIGADVATDAAHIAAQRRGFNKLSKSNGFQTDVDKAVYNSNLWLEKNFKIPPKLDMAPVEAGLGRISMAVGIIAGSVTAVVGVIAALVVGLQKVAELYDSLIEKNKQFAKNKEIIDGIDALGSSIAKTQAILETFGKDGLEVFRKLREENAQLQKELNAADGFSPLLSTGKALWEGTKQWAIELTAFLSGGVFSKLLPLMSMMGLGTGDMAKLYESEQDLLKAQANADKVDKNKVELAKERKKIQEEIDKTERETMQAADEWIQRQHQERLKNLAEEAKLAEDLLNKTADDIVKKRPPGAQPIPTDPNDPNYQSPATILDNEVNALRDSVLTPSEAALKNANELGEAGAKGKLGSDAVKDTLRKARKAGEEGSFKRQIGSANAEDQRTKILDRANKLDQILSDYIRNGGAFNINPRNSK